MKHNLAILVCLLLCSACYADEPMRPEIKLPCTIIDVHDGDTITVEVRVPIRVRMLDCWAPEVYGEEKPQGIISRDHLREIALDKEGILHVDFHAKAMSDLFSFGRLLGEVWVDGENLSERMVEDGKATATRGGK